MPKTSGDSRLTDRQKMFADSYMIDLNATRAYKVAYPNVKKDPTAAAAATRLLKNVNVACYIEDKMQKRSKRTEVTQDMVVKELAKIAFADITDYVEIDEAKKVIIKPTSQIDSDKIGAIAGIKEGQNGIEVKINDKQKALELLGRHLGMFTDKQEITATISYEDYIKNLSAGGEF